MARVLEQTPIVCGPASRPSAPQPPSACLGWLSLWTALLSRGGQVIRRMYRRHSDLNAACTLQSDRVATDVQPHALHIEASTRLALRGSLTPTVFTHRRLTLPAVYRHHSICRSI